MRSDFSLEHEYIAHVVVSILVINFQQLKHTYVLDTSLKHNPNDQNKARSGHMF